MMWLLLLWACVLPIGPGQQALIADVDRDGEPSIAQGGADCDDLNAAVHPGASEWCNGLDDDCDGNIDGPAARGVVVYWRDADGDGAGDPDAMVRACTPPEGHVGNDVDCDDEADTVYPGATEVCDDVDNDCDGRTDSADNDLDATSLKTFYIDRDGDSYGDPSTGRVQCSSGGRVEDGTDCDDGDNSVHPGAAEVCDGIDQDCDNTADNGLSNTDYYRDRDGDSYGNPAVAVSDCARPNGYVADNTDCDDRRALVNPGASEVCNGRDDDCSNGADDGLVLNTLYPDWDADGFGDGNASVQTCFSTRPNHTTDNTDCDDTDATRFPGNVELCDAVDHDCNSDPNPASVPTWFFDKDTDGYGNDSVSQQSCLAPTGYVAVGGDCNDDNAQIHPGATEVCGVPGVDEDCANGADDNDPNVTEQRPWYPDIDGDTFGDDASVVWACVAPQDHIAVGGDCNDGDTTVRPDATEICDDGIDQNCDGAACGLDGEQNLDDADVTFTPGTGWNDVASLGVGDLNGDGVPDLAAAFPGATISGDFGAVALTFGALDAAPTALDSADIVLHSGTWANAIEGAAVADLDEDGIADLLVRESLALNVVLGPTPSTWPTPDARITATGGFESLVTGDHDNDGTVDLWLSDSTTSRVYLFAGPVSGNLTDGDYDVQITGSDDAPRVAGGDLNGDGRPDLLVGDDNALHIIAGPLGANVDLADADSVLTGPVGGRLGRTVAIADLDGDGANDAVGASPFTGQVYQVPGPWFARNAAIADQARTTLIDADANLGLGTSVTTGDHNGDGLPDLALSAPMAAPTAATVFLFYAPLPAGTLDPAMAEGSLHANPDAATTLHTADVDRDGHDDLLVGASSAFLFYGAGL